MPHPRDSQSRAAHALACESESDIESAIPCSLNYSFRGTERVLKGLGIAPATRGHAPVSRPRLARQHVDPAQGWHGARPSRWPSITGELGPYSLRRCTLCSDMLGELSDLTCGDAWIPEVMQADKVGSSFVVSRTAGGGGAPGSRSVERGGRVIGTWRARSCWLRRAMPRSRRGNWRLGCRSSSGPGRACRRIGRSC